ncbi:hypothetical protein [Beduini massiliensis]|uniref:hypothetical protein n=1 Tax=Beduini massiliensis TaxID=1585974 RepID=UPI00059A7E35|nr:hypothetical protein [Beduini massiliensis]
MYLVSEEFKKAIRNNARKIKCYFIYENKIYYPQGLTLDDNIYSEETESFIGTFIAKSGILKLDVKTVLSLENKSIDIFMGVYCNNNYEYVPLGKFFIYEKISDYEYKIMDSKMLFNIPFDPSEIVYPITALDLLEKVCIQSGVELFTSDFPNKDILIDKEIFFGYEATCFDVVSAVAQASCSFAHINRENQLELKWFCPVDFNIRISNQLEYPVLTESYGPINSLVLARDPQNDNVYIQDAESIEKNGLLELKISNNPILDIDRVQTRLPIWNRIKDFTYQPLTINSQGLFHLDPGDIVKVETNKREEIDAVIMNHNIDFNGGVASFISSPALSRAEINYSIASSIESKLLRTELKVDKIKGEIVSSIENIEKTIENIQVDNLDISIEQSQIAITNKNPSVSLNAKIILNGQDITSTLGNESIKWHRVSENRDADIKWDDLQLNNKVIEINSEDIALYANFYCVATTPYGSCMSNYALVTDETDISNLQVYINTNQPNYQGYDNGVYSPDWSETGNLVLTPVVMDHYKQIPLSDCDIVWQKINGELDETEIQQDGVLMVTTNKMTSEIKKIGYIVSVKYHYSSISKTIEFTSYQNQEEVSIGDKIYYTWVYYADNDLGDGLSPNPLGKQFIGIANMQIEKEPPYTIDEDGNKIYSDLSAFVWTKMKDYRTVLEQDGEPTDTSCLWLDSNTGQLKKYYTFLKSWAPINDETPLRDTAENVYITTEKSSTANFTILSNAINSTVKNVERVESELGSQMSEVSSKIEQNATNIQFSIEKISEITSGLASDEALMNEMKTYFKFDEQGLHISKSDNSFEMILSDTELGFYDGKTRVAYISNKRLYIEQVVVVQSLQIGDYTLRYDNDIGFVLQ